jgi:hypothetical protein
VPLFTIECIVLKLDGQNSLHIRKTAINIFEAAAADSRLVVIPLLWG